MSLMSRKPQISWSSDSTGAERIRREARVCSIVSVRMTGALGGQGSTG